MTNFVAVFQIGPENLSLETLRSHNLAVTRTHHHLPAFFNS